jgi:hypothetical protein
MADPRLRQVALVARELASVAPRLQAELSLGSPYRDPGVDAFGLENVVFAVGDSFLEVVAPVREGTTAGRYLERQGRDGGYMAIFQFTDLEAARRRVADLGIRVVWQSDHDDIAGTHLHPKDVPGAIVSLDWADPSASWRWGGPDWTGGAPDHVTGGITGLTVESPDPEALARRWAEVLGVTADGTTVVIDGGRQTLSFVPSASGSEGITAVDFALDDTEGQRTVEVGTATVRVSDKQS